MPDKAAQKKHPLSIRLTESAVFLRSDGSGRRNRGQEDRPSLLRGLLTLELQKPMRISSIELGLKAKSSTTWPEGVGARRAEVTEEHEVYRASTTFFSANGEHTRRNSSLGPGAAYFAGEYDSDEAHPTSPLSPREASSSRQHEPREVFATGGPLSGRTRRMSADSSYFFRDHASAEPTLFPPTPPYSPPVTSPSSSSSELNAPISAPAPAYTLEEHRNILNAELRDRRNHSQTPGSSNSSGSARTTRRPDPPLSRQPSIEDIPEYSQPASASNADRSYSREQGTPRNYSRTPSRTPSRVSSPHRSQSSAGHDEVRRPSSRSRFSLASVSHVLKDVVRHHSHDTNGHHEEEEGRGRPKEKRSVTASPNTSKERSTFSKLGEMLKLEHDDANLRQGWKEFKAGTYTYPISFEIPANSPPSLRCDFGSVTWRLRAVVHRPGTFTSKLAVNREVIVITAPTEDDTEDSENIIVERMWENQLQYLISVSGRSFYIGGTIPVTFGLLPLAKAKIHRLSLHLEEKVDYYTNMKRVARSDPPTRIDLLNVKSEHPGHGEHILPLDSDDAEAFRHSPLYALADPEKDVSEEASSFMGPGPWTFHKELQLPMSCLSLHISNKNKRSNILVTHHLKCVIRVESANEAHVDPKTGKRKLFDIVIQTPVQILSCRCNPAWSSLPPYSEVFDDHSVVVPLCPCEVRRQHDARPAALERMVSRLSFESAVSAAQTRPVNPLTMPSLQSRNELYERLVSGQESETGEAPPEYWTVSATPVVPSPH